MITGNEFKAALGRFASGVTVVTTKDKAGRWHGLTVSAFSSVSLEPPLVLVCILKRTGSHHAFAESGVFVVNILSDEQKSLSNHFASHSDDKFSGIEYTLGIENVPVLAGCLVNLECRLKYAHEGGDHTIFVGAVEKAQIYEGKPLLYFHGNYNSLKN